MTSDPFSGKRWWIVGASEGLGLALARQLHGMGAEVVASARGAARLAELAAECPGIVPVVMDVTVSASVAAASDAVGTPDGIIYCAGSYEPMTARHWRPGLAEAMTEVNFTGALRVLSHLVPAMAARGRGHVVLIGSLAGYRGLPGAIGYGASKAALMHLGENLRADLRGSGLRVQVVNPGFIATRLTRKNPFRMPQIMTPQEAASQVVRAMRRGAFSTAFPRPFSWLFVLGRYLPLKMFHSVLR